jgi:hypothetical protein
MKYCLKHGSYQGLDCTTCLQLKQLANQEEQTDLQRVSIRQAVLAQELEQLRHKMLYDLEKQKLAEIRKQTRLIFEGQVTEDAAYHDGLNLSEVVEYDDSDMDIESRESLFHNMHCWVGISGELLLVTIHPAYISSRLKSAYTKGAQEALATQKIKVIGFSSGVPFEIAKETFEVSAHELKNIQMKIESPLFEKRLLRRAQFELEAIPLEFSLFIDRTDGKIKSNLREKNQTRLDIISGAVAIDDPKIFWNWLLDYVNQSIEVYNSVDDCNLRLRLSNLAHHDAQLWGLYQQHKAEVSAPEDLSRGSGWIFWTVIAIACYIAYYWPKLFL